MEDHSWRDAEGRCFVRHDFGPYDAIELPPVGAAIQFPVAYQQGRAIRVRAHHGHVVALSAASPDIFPSPDIVQVRDDVSGAYYSCAPALHDAEEQAIWHW